MLKNCVRRFVCVASMLVVSFWGQVASAQFPYQNLPSIGQGCNAAGGLGYQSGYYGNPGFQQGYSSGYAPSIYGQKFAPVSPYNGAITQYPQNEAAPSYNYYSNSYSHGHSHHGRHPGQYLSGHY